MTDPIRHEIACDDGAMSYLDWGGTGPGLHFAHANGFNAETYRTLLTPLAERLHPFASDARGHGFTTLLTTPGLPRNWTIYRHDLGDLLDSVHPAPLVLAGHSMGSIASLMFAVAHPERVRALVLVEPVLMPAMHPLRRQFARLARRYAKTGDPDLADRAAKRRDRFASADAAFAAYRGRGAFRTWPDAMLRDYLHGGLIATGNGTEMRLGCTPAWEAESFRSTPAGVRAAHRPAALPAHCPSCRRRHGAHGRNRRDRACQARRTHPACRRRLAFSADGISRRRAR